MKLIRFGSPSEERPGVELESGERKDCSQHFKDWNREFFQADGLARLAQLLATRSGVAECCNNDAAGGSCGGPGKVMCIGLNYSDHAAEAGMPLPSEPILFLKASNTVVGPYDDVLIPRHSQKTDWEVELGVVIGADARYLASPADAERYIAGYCISHDISEREFQLERGGQWTKGKSCDTFNPLGPYLVTRDAVKSPNALQMTLAVNGESMQNGNTSTMVFSPAYIVHYLSQFMTLEAGDVITTGTPPGVGMGKKPQQFLRNGDVVELAIEGLGSQRQVCRDA